MDRRTIIAVVISVIIMIVWSFYFNPQQQKPTVQDQQVIDEPSIEEKIEESTDLPLVKQTEKILKEETVSLETDIFKIEFTTKGGDVKSLQLKQHNDGDQLVQMINKGTSDINAFNIRFGGIEHKPINDIFNYKKIGDYEIEFFQTFHTNANTEEESIPFTLKKTYVFKPQEYILELQISIVNSVKESPNLNYNGLAYTLSFGPQIGPSYKKLDNRNEYRKYYTFEAGKKKETKISKKENSKRIDRNISWAAIAGKYFSLVGIPYDKINSVVFSNEKIMGVKDGSQLFFTRPVIKSSDNTDTYRFYIGPKSEKFLKKYNKKETNSFDIDNLRIDVLFDAGFLGWLAGFLKLILDFFYGITRNYGWSIILLTIFTKLIFYPLTHKSYESNSRMQAISPKINEIKAKYKSNPQKMNQEMAELYKREKINPLGGCLPLFVQIPIFFDLFKLFNNQFELRGAPFLLWINDLSAPDSILNFGNISIPVIESDLRLLPILMAVTSIFSSKMMQSPEQSSNNQMKFMVYGMPLFLLFILYHSPSGLLLYWTVSNLLTVVMQKLVPKFMKAKS
jgi:YidC/Oxa1 family membrane protein insertase